MNLNLYQKNQRAMRWYPVEVRVEGERTQVIECCAYSKHEAFHMAINSMTAADLNRAAGGINLRILAN